MIRFIHLIYLINHQIIIRLSMTNQPSPNYRFLQYLVDYFDETTPDGEEPHLPSLEFISKELKVSIAGLREQLEVARALGLVEVKPRTGIRRLPYTFYPAVWQSLSYAIARDRTAFESFSLLRNHIEASFWHEAVTCLLSEDHEYLMNLVKSAQQKLNGERRFRIQIPHEEHRQLHLRIFSRLDNPFVLGLLEAYWQAYEEVGLSDYADYEYLREVWDYHAKMVDGICRGDFEAGYNALIEHKDLLFQRPQVSV
jgi:DNA-binding FadR family transcriptional regulator